MDRRATLLLALGLILSCLGCIAPPNRKVAALAEKMPAPLGKEVPPEAAPALAPRAPAKGKRNPKAATCVAGANLQLGEAANAKLTPLQKEQLYDNARKGFQQALTIDPNCVEAYLGLGRLYAIMGQFDKALETFQDGLKKQPRNAELWFQVGVCQARHKDWAPALQSLHKAHELEPENRSCTNTLGLCLAVAGRQDEALEMLTKSVGPAQGHFWMGRLCLVLNQPERCKEHLRLALQADANLAGARDLLARLENPGTPAATPRRQAIADLGFEDLQ